MRRALLLLLFACGAAPTSPSALPLAKKKDCACEVCPCPRAPATDDDAGVCAVETPCQTRSALDASADASAPRATAPQANAVLPPPRPTTIPLSRGAGAPGDAELSLGDASFEKNDLEQAAKQYKAAQALAPKHPGPLVGLARVRIAKTNVPLDYGAGKGNTEIEAAVKDLKRAAASDDAYGPAHVELGRALLMLGDAGGALASLTTGARLMPQEPEAHSALGVAKLALGKTDEAVAALAKAAELDPGSAARRGNYGTVLLMRGRTEDALKEYRAAAQIAPNDARARSDLGTALLAGNDVRGAITELERAIALDPSRATYHSNYGYALQIKGELPKAIAEYRAALKIDDKLASAWINLATALARDPATRREARAALEKARAIDPTDPRVKANLEELDQLEKGH